MFLKVCDVVYNMETILDLAQTDYSDMMMGVMILVSIIVYYYLFTHDRKES